MALRPRDIVELPAPFAARAAQGAAWVREQGAAGRAVTVVHHIDADGVTAGAIAAEALARTGVAARMRPVKSLDQHHVDQLVAEDHQAFWFCDLGSTAYMHCPATPKLVCDHHQLVRDGAEDSFPHVNPLLDGLDGGEVSGAGCCLAVALALDPRNVDLLPIALVGATADRQDRPLHGINALYLAAAQKVGLVDAAVDLSFFGPETRGLVKFLTLANEPAIPGVAGDATGAQRLLRDAGVDVDAARTWGDLTEPQRRAVRTALVTRLLDAGLAAEIPRLWRTVVRIRREPRGPTRELQEFGTLLNSTARYDRPDVGIAVARGDRGTMLEEALDLLDGHRKHLVGALDALAKKTVRETAALQWVDLEDAVRDTVVGIVAGMALGSLGLRQDKPLIAFAWTPDGRTKVSSRAPQQLKGRIDLSVAVREAAAVVAGQGGGHPGAAGATIPRGAEARFLAALDTTLAGQLGLASPTAAPAAPRGPSRQAKLAV